MKPINAYFGDILLCRIFGDCSMLRPKPTVIVLKPEEIESARSAVIPSGESEEKLKKLRASRLKL